MFSDPGGIMIRRGLTHTRAGDLRFTNGRQHIRPALTFLVLPLLVFACEGSMTMMTEDDAGVVPPSDGASPPRPRPRPRADASARPTGPLVDPECTDGMFVESLPDPTVDISDLVAAYRPARYRAFIDGALARRYSTGLAITTGGSSERDCVEPFLRDTSTANEVISSLSTVVHECGHFYDFNLGGFDSDEYYVNDTPLQFSCNGGDSVPRGGNTFARSRINDDPLGAAVERDSYSSLYLSGNPDDDTFDSGDQGFNSLLEETFQYVNSLAVSYAFESEINRGSGFRTSQRDGISTFLWWVQRYLHMARTSYPDAYDHIVNGDSGCWRRAVLTVWGRAWLYLNVTEDLPHLGINDDEMLAVVNTPELVAEIDRLRDVECPGR